MVVRWIRSTLWKMETPEDLMPLMGRQLDKMCIKLSTAGLYWKISYNLQC